MTWDGALPDAAGMPQHRHLIRSGLLLFWAAWFTLVTLTNVLDALKALGLLPAAWTFASGNFGLMLKVTGIHGTPTTLVALLFVGVIVWEALAAVLFWRAWASGGAAISTAFVVALALSAAFTLADEIFIAYALEAAHLRVLGLQLLSLLALQLLPDD